MRDAQRGRTRVGESVARFGARETGQEGAVARTRSYSQGLSGGFWEWTVLWCCVGASLSAPEWVPTAWAREDGPVEWMGFGCFLIACALAFVASFRSRPDRWWVLGCAALGAVLLCAAGEEISWGQRLFHVETPEALIDGNRQDELNLHNIDGLQDKAVVAQLAIAAAGVLLAGLVSRPWARAGLPFFAAYVAYRCGRGVSALVGWGEADRNSEVAEMLLAVGLLVMVSGLVADRSVRRFSELAIEQGGRVASRPQGRHVRSR